jgi:hypothetical protein
MGGEGVYLLWRGNIIGYSPNKPSINMQRDRIDITTYGSSGPEYMPGPIRTELEINGLEITSKDENIDMKDQFTYVAVIGEMIVGQMCWVSEWIEINRNPSVMNLKLIGEGQAIAEQI